MYGYDLPGLRIWSTYFLHSAELRVFAPNQTDHILKPEKAERGRDARRMTAPRCLGDRKPEPPRLLLSVYFNLLFLFSPLVRYPLLSVCRSLSVSLLYVCRALSIFISACLSVCLSVCLCASVFVPLSLCLRLCASVSLFVSVPLSLSLCLCVSLCQSLSVCLCPFACLSVYVGLSAVCLSVSLSVSLFLSLSISLNLSSSSLHISLNLSRSLSLSVYLPRDLSLSFLCRKMSLVTSPSEVSMGLQKQHKKGPLKHRIGQAPSEEYAWRLMSTSKPEILRWLDVAPAPSVWGRLNKRAPHVLSVCVQAASQFCKQISLPNSDSLS